mmetsp:Transcript_25669/g.54580  ORF Transcript_25669/g.54580 Transcript_25669/m.54580 type:complete len:204 (-) Transcript_25669:1005-1616(-)
MVWVLVAPFRNLKFPLYCVESMGNVEWASVTGEMPSSVTFLTRLSSSSSRPLSFIRSSIALASSTAFSAITPKWYLLVIPVEKCSLVIAQLPEHVCVPSASTLRMPRIIAVNCSGGMRGSTGSSPLGAITSSKVKSDGDGATVPPLTTFDLGSDLPPPPAPPFAGTETLGCTLLFPFTLGVWNFRISVIVPSFANVPVMLYLP